MFPAGGTAFQEAVLEILEQLGNWWLLKKNSPPYNFLSCEHLAACRNGILVFPSTQKTFNEHQSIPLVYTIVNKWYGLLYL
jgi:hypothetical protein